ncbi:hypothetical protein ZIOFF_009739 [Zingiber officinale]|uniref:Uncharacterized protein n=1 Tax=Zingiber officinale TaxID=94328 RepID=A0A8J5I357_ZINOF|nr:hypothetical protein ZIOFF_009739 [Zingiber officinale]
MEDPNLVADYGEHAYRLRMNRFADLTNEEYRARLQVGSLMKLYNSSMSAMKVVGWCHISYLDRLMELLGGLRLNL